MNHIAFVVPELEAITPSLPAFCKPFDIEMQPAEGTREQYVAVGDDTAPMLLLMQPVADGPYLRALNKRGAGLHHIGGTTPSIDALLPEIEKSRLLLHPISLKTLTHKTIWLCRPGVPFLIEVIETETTGSAGQADPCYLQIPAKWPIPPFVHAFFDNLSLQNTDDERFHVGVGDKRVSLF